MMPSIRRNTLIGGLVLLWLAGLTAFYFVYHKPITPSVAFRLGQAGVDILVPFGILSIVGGLGKRLLSAGRLRTGETQGAKGWTFTPVLEGMQGFHPLSQVAAEALLGIGLLSVVLLILGTALPVSRAGAWILFILLGWTLRRHVRAWWAAWRGVGDVLRAAEWTGRLGLIGALLILLLTLLVALAPPVKFDSLVYHLAIPANYLENGRVEYLPENIFWGMPQTAELAFTWAIALGSVQSAAVLSWGLGLLGLIGVTGLSAELSGDRWAWVAPVVLLSGYSTATMLSTGYVDWAAFAFGCAFLLWVSHWRQRKDPAHLAMAGVMAGMALGTKYTAGLLLLGGVGLILWEQRASFKLTLKPLVQFGGPFLAVSIPWWAKNWIATGNPFYPLLFPAGAMDPIRLAFYQKHAAWGSWLDVPLLPLRATILGVESSPGYGLSAGPFLLGFGALAWLGLKDREPASRSLLGTAAMVSLLGWMGWAVAGRFSSLLISARLYLSLFSAFALLAVAGFEGIASLRLPAVRFDRIAAILMLFVFGLNLFQVSASVSRTGALRYLLGEISADQYLSDNLGWYNLAMDAVRDLPEPGRVLLLWEARGYYCQPGCEPDEVLDRWVHKMRTLGSPELIRAAWQEAGYSYVLFYRAGADFIRQEDPRYSREEWLALDRFLADLPAPVDFGGIYELYSLGP